MNAPGWHNPPLPATLLIEAAGPSHSCCVRNWIGDKAILQAHFKPHVSRLLAQSCLVKAQDSSSASRRGSRSWIFSSRGN